MVDSEGRRHCLRCLLSDPPKAILLVSNGKHFKCPACGHLIRNPAYRAPKPYRETRRAPRKNDWPGF
jgi:predicted RNA-binding Zn-ribbon protein involved in translation (DUF1610 family)